MTGLWLNFIWSINSIILIWDALHVLSGPHWETRHGKENESQVHFLQPYKYNAKWYTTTQYNIL